MGSTTNLSLPYPLLGDSDNVPRDIKALAEALDLPGRIYRPYVELTASAATTMSATPNTYTKIALATTSHLDGVAANFTIASSVITIVQAGVYDISGQGGFSGGASGTRGISIHKNGIGAIGSFEQFTTTDTSWLSTVTALGVTLAANDTLQLVGYASVASLATYHTSPYFSRLMVRRVG